MKQCTSAEGRLGNATVNPYVVHHASMGGEFTVFDTRTFYIEPAFFMMGPWTQAFYLDNSTNVSSNNLTYGIPRSLRSIRLRVNKPNPGSDLVVRIPEFEIWGTPGAILLPSTGRYQAWSTKTIGNSNVTTGWPYIKFKMKSTGFSVNCFRLIL